MRSTVTASDSSIADAADHRHVAEDLDAELRQQLPRDGASGDTRCRLPGARALQHIADVLDGRT